MPKAQTQTPVIPGSFTKMWAVRLNAIHQPGDVVPITKADGTTTTVTLAVLAPGESMVWLIVPTKRSR